MKYLKLAFPLSVVLFNSYPVYELTRLIRIYWKDHGNLQWPFYWPFQAELALIWGGYLIAITIAFLWVRYA